VRPRCRSAADGQEPAAALSGRPMQKRFWEAVGQQSEPIRLPALRQP